MTSDLHNSSCSRFESEFLRVACGDTVLSGAAREHWESCDACRAVWLENNELIAALRRALAPRPLGADVSSQVLARLMPVRPVGRSRAWMQWAGALAAACLLAAWLPTWQSPVAETPSERHGASAMSLSREDTAEIIAAMRVLNWENPAERSLEGLVRKAEQAAARMERAKSADTLLPWSAEEDWDIPATAGASGTEKTRAT